MIYVPKELVYKHLYCNKYKCKKDSWVKKKPHTFLVTGAGNTNPEPNPNPNPNPKFPNSDPDPVRLSNREREEVYYVQQAHNRVVSSS